MHIDQTGTNDAPRRVEHQIGHLVRLRNPIDIDNFAVCEQKIKWFIDLV